MGRASSLPARRAIVNRIAKTQQVPNVTGWAGVEAVEHALEPFEGIVDELLASLPGAGLG